MFKNHAISWENQTVIRFEIKFCFFAQLKRNVWYCFKLALETALWCSHNPWNIYHLQQADDHESKDYQDDNMTVNTSTGKKTIKTVTLSKVSCHRRARLVSEELDGNYISGFARQNNAE